MPENNQPDLEDFQLELDGALKIAMPAQPEVTEEDIDAQLFSFIANAPKGSKLTSLADLDDAWAQEAYPGISGIQEMREVIKQRLKQDSDYAYYNMKVALTCDALVASLRGAIPEELIKANIDEVRRRSEYTIHSNGKSLNQYLKEMDMSEEEFEQKLLEETEHDIAMNIALDKYVDQNTIAVAEEELAQYLNNDDPEAFMQELRQANKVEEAKIAAARVKAMRTLLEEVEVQEKSA